MSKQKGFSLIELLIVVAIILIIAAIAIPNLLRSRIAANNAAAAASVRTLTTAEYTYTTAYPAAGFTATIGILGPGAASCPGGGTSAAACIIDSTLGGTAAGTAWTNKDAFWFNITTSGSDYTVTAQPITGQGSKRFCANGDGSIHVEDPNTTSVAAGTAASSGNILQANCPALPAQ